MTPMQYDIERHTPERLAQAYRVAADTAEHNPYLSADERAKRAKNFRDQADQFESRLKQ